MGNKLYVGNLPYGVRDNDLEQAFGEFGAVTSAKVMMERDTGRSKGFGFVEMGSEASAPLWWLWRRWWWLRRRWLRRRAQWRRRRRWWLWRRP